MVRSFDDLLSGKQVSYSYQENPKSDAIVPLDHYNRDLLWIVQAQLERTAGINDAAYPGMGNAIGAAVIVSHLVHTPAPSHPQDLQDSQGQGGQVPLRDIAYSATVTLLYSGGRAIVTGPFAVAPDMNAVTLDAELRRAARFIPDYALAALPDDGLAGRFTAALVEPITQNPVPYQQIVDALTSLADSLVPRAGKEGELAERIIRQQLRLCFMQLIASIVQNEQAVFPS